MLYYLWYRNILIVLQPIFPFISKILLPNLQSLSYEGFRKCKVMLVYFIPYLIILLA